MGFMLFSAEDFPATRKNNPAFQDTKEFLVFNGFHIGPVKKDVWMPVSRRQARTEYQDFTDKRGSRIVQLDDEFADAFNSRFAIENSDSPDAGRGLKIITDDEYADPAKRKAVEDECHTQNNSFRLRRIADFELQLQERQVTGKGRGYPTPYEEECYDVTGTTRPGSPEALAAMRNPGRQVATDLTMAMLEAANAIKNRKIELTPEEAEEINRKIEADKEVNPTAAATVFAGDPNQVA